MYTKITGEFESVEFAETAARYIRERVNGEKQLFTPIKINLRAAQTVKKHL